MEEFVSDDDTAPAKRLRGNYFKCFGTDFNCSPCNYKTSRYSNFEKHKKSRKHSMVEFYSCSREDENQHAGGACGFDIHSDDIDLGDRESIPPSPQSQMNIQDVLDSDDDDDDDDDDDESDGDEFDIYSELEDGDEDNDISPTSNSEWYPFNTKDELLFYAFLNSSTHTVSDAVAQFVYFMIQECGGDIKRPFHSFKKMKFGSLSWEQLVSHEKDDKGQPFTMIKPSEMLRLIVSNPKVAANICRVRSTDGVIREQLDGKRYEEISPSNDALHESVFHPINVFMDDTSTNLSRRWNAFHTVQFQSALIPNALRQKHRNVKFTAASEKVPIVSMLHAVKKDIDEMNRDGITTYEPIKAKEVRVHTAVSAGITDYNQLCDCCNHLGSATNKYCPRCYADKSTFDVMGRTRTPNETVRLLNRMVIRRNNKDIQKQHGLREMKIENPLWKMLNPHQDLPVGLLHWLFLGLAKHLVKFCVTSLTDTGKERLMCHLVAMDQSSFSMPFTCDITKYVDSRQGKDFKHYLQIAPFNMEYAGLDKRYVTMLCKLAEISKNLICTVEYTDDTVDNLQDKLSDYLSEIRQHLPDFKRKVKSHMTTHLCDDIKRHGPPKSFVEDQFEKNNGTIRKVLFKQNQLARSRDTAAIFAKREVLNHILDGGFFKNDEGNWVSCKDMVKEYAATKEIKNFLGQGGDEISRDIPGHLKKFKGGQGRNTDRTCSAIVSQSGELVNEGNAVMFSIRGETKVGIFRGGMKRNGRNIASVQKMIDLDETFLGCNLMKMDAGTIEVPGKDIEKKVCLIHQCEFCHIAETTARVRTEQMFTDIRKKVLKHNKDHNVYILNKYRCTH